MNKELLVLQSTCM